LRAIQREGILRGTLVGGRDVFEDLMRGWDRGRWQLQVVDRLFGFEAREAFEYLKVNISRYSCRFIRVKSILGRLSLIRVA
jgi:hypothetical protein